MSKSGLQLVENELIEAREEDESSPWYVARILKFEGRRILIHYLNWHKRHDQWLPARSPRIRALSKQNANKRLEDQNKRSMFAVGQAIEAKWIDKHYYPGTILSAEGNDYYRVLFTDGFKKKLKCTQIKLPCGAQEPAPVPEPAPKEEHAASNRAKRLSARNADDAVTGSAANMRPKRLSARHSRASSGECRAESRVAAFLKEVGSTSETEDDDNNSTSTNTLIIDDVAEFDDQKPLEQSAVEQSEQEPGKENAVKEASKPVACETRTATQKPSSESRAVPSQNIDRPDSKISVVKSHQTSRPAKHPENSKIPIISSDESHERSRTTASAKECKLTAEETVKEKTEENQTPVPQTETKHAPAPDARQSAKQPNVVERKQELVESKQVAVDAKPVDTKPGTLDTKPATVDTKQGTVDVATAAENAAMSDHISQLQKNQRDQSARLIAAKGVKDVVYQSGGYSHAAAMIPGLKQPAVYMPHVPMYSQQQYSQFFPNTSIPNVWGVPAQYVSSAYSASPAPAPVHLTTPAPSVRLTTPAATPQMEYQRQPTGGPRKTKGNEASPTTVHMSPITSYSSTSPTMGSPHHAAPSPHHASPHHASPHHASPHHASPHHAVPSPHHASPHHAVPSPHHASPHHAVPSPHHAVQHLPSPHHASPHLPSPHHASPHHATQHHASPHHAAPGYSPTPAAYGAVPRKPEGKPGEPSGKQRRGKREGSSDSLSRKSHKRGPEEPKHARKIVKKSGNQAEALKKISYDIYDFPVSMTTKSSKKATDAKSKESDASEESESSAGESEISSSQSTPTAPHQPHHQLPHHHMAHQLPPPYYVNYPFYPNVQTSKITNPIHQMNMIAQQYHAQNRHHLYQQQMVHPSQHKQRGRKTHPNRTQSPSKMRIHNQTIDANTAQLLRHHQMAQQQQKAGQKGAVQMPPQYKTPVPEQAEPTSFRGLLESEDVIQGAGESKNDKQAGQQPQAYLSVMKLDKHSRGQGPMIESYPVHGSFKSTVPRVSKVSSPKGSQPNSPSGGKKTCTPSPSGHGMSPQMRPQYQTPAQIQKVSNPARLPPGYEMQQQIYRYPHPIGYAPHHNPNHPAMFKPVSVPSPQMTIKSDEASRVVQPTPMISPRPVVAQDPVKPDDSISAAIQDHLTSDDLWMADDTNFDISDLANYLDGGSNSAIPDDLIEQKTESKKTEPSKQKPPTVNKPRPTTSAPPSATAEPEGVRKSLRERRVSAKLLESGVSIPAKITVSVNNIPTKPNTITVLPSIDTLTSSPAAAHAAPSPVAASQRKPKTPISDMHGATPHARRSSPPALVKGVPTSPLKQKLKQYVLERQARQAANRTPPRTLPEAQPSHNRSPGSIENPLIQRRMSQSPSPTNWQQLIQFGRSSPNFIASLSPRSRQALFDMHKDPRMSPYCRTSPVPSDLAAQIRPDMKKESVSPKLSKPVVTKEETAKPIPVLPPRPIPESSPLFVQPIIRPQIKEEPLEPAPQKGLVPTPIVPKITALSITPSVSSSPTVSSSPSVSMSPSVCSSPSVSRATTTALTKAAEALSKDAALHIKMAKSNGEQRLSRSVPTTPEGGYNTRKIKVQTLALLGQKAIKSKSRKNSDTSIKNSPKNSPNVSRVDDLKTSTPAPPVAEPPKSLVLKTPEKRIVAPKTETPDNPFEPVFTTSSSNEMISPFKDVMSRHLSLPSSFDMNFDDNDLFMDEEITKLEHNTSLDDQDTCPPMQADSDLTTPLVGDITLETKKECKELGSLDSPLDKKKGRVIRPRAKSTISPDDERRKSNEEDRKRLEPRLLLARSIISESRASKRARSSSEPFTTPNIDADDHRHRKQYYYYGEPKATKAIEPLDDHLEFKCNICKKAFPKQSRLETHLKHYHEGKENVAEEGSEEKPEPQIIVRCTCESTLEDKLMLQCDECLNWVHGRCIGVNTSNIPNQYICAFCYAVVKQLTDWYDDGNLPTLVPETKREPNERMLSLHDMSEQYQKIAEGLLSTRLKLDSFERSEARQLQGKKDGSNGTWQSNGRKMEGTLVVIPGSGSVLLPNSSAQSHTGDPKNNASLVYVLSPGSAKTSTTSTIRGKTVYTVNRPPLVMSLSQLRQQNPNFRPAAMRGQLRPLSIRPSFRGQAAPRYPGGITPRQGVPHVVRGTMRGSVMRTARYTAPSPLTSTARMPGAARSPSPRLASSPVRQPVARLPSARLPTSPSTRGPSIRMPSHTPPARLPGNTAGFRPTRNPSPQARLPSNRLPGTRPDSPNSVPPRGQVSPRGQVRQRNTSSPRVQSPLSSPRPSPQPGSSPRHHTKSEPATPTYLSHSRSSSPRLQTPTNRLTSRSRPQSPRVRTDLAPLMHSVHNPIASLAAKQFQESLAAEISEGQDIIEAHITALEKHLDEFEKLSDNTKLEPAMQLGHVLYDLEQLKILTQTV